MMQVWVQECPQINIQNLRACRLLNSSSSRRSTLATRLPHTFTSSPSGGSSVRGRSAKTVNSW